MVTLAAVTPDHHTVTCTRCKTWGHVHTDAETAINAYRTHNCEDPR